MTTTMYHASSRNQRTPSPAAVQAPRADAEQHEPQQEIDPLDPAFNDPAQTARAARDVVAHRQAVDMGEGFKRQGCATPVAPPWQTPRRAIAGNPRSSAAPAHRPASGRSRPASGPARRHSAHRPARPNSIGATTFTSLAAIRHNTAITTRRLTHGLSAGQRYGPTLRIVRIPERRSSAAISASVLLSAGMNWLSFCPVTAI